MDEFSCSCKKDLFFSFSHSNSSGCAVWKVKDFWTLKKTLNDYESPKFSFKDVNWRLFLYPNRCDDASLGYVCLYLKPCSYFPLTLKYKFILKNEFAKDLNSQVIEQDFAKGEELGFGEILEMRDIPHGKLGHFLSDDVLTICCEMMIVEDFQGETATSTGAAKSPPTFNLRTGKDSLFGSNLREAYVCSSFSDVVLRVGEETIPAHKLILSARSEVFKSMFKSDMKENQDNAVDVVDMESSVAKAMLLYMYTSEVEELSTEKTLELYVAADRYMLMELKEKCREYLSNNLSSKNVGEVFETACFHSDDLLSKAAKKFFAVNVRSILESAEWEEFSVQKPSHSVQLLSFAIKSNHFF